MKEIATRNVNGHNEHSRNVRAHTQQSCMHAHTLTCNTAHKPARNTQQNKLNRIKVIV